MIIIQHRVNEIEELEQTPGHLGIEVDVRSNAEGLYLHHDPFTVGPSFGHFLDFYDHSFIVLNVKEEGLEEQCLQLLEHRGIKNYFFLDQTMPFLIRRGLQGNRDSACRVSEYESLDTAQSLAGFCEWSWVDSFQKGGLDFETLEKLKSLNFRICLVSPELHGTHRLEEAKNLVGLLKDAELQIDAVCTKYPTMWG